MLNFELASQPLFDFSVISGLTLFRVLFGLAYQFSSRKERFGSSSQRIIDLSSSVIEAETEKFVASSIIEPGTTAHAGEPSSPTTPLH